MNIEYIFINEIKNKKEYSNFLESIFYNYIIENIDNYKENNISHIEEKECDQ